MAQDPNVHLSLIGILIVVVIGYIIYLQRGVVTRQMGALFNGTPLQSRDAGEPIIAPGGNRAVYTIAREDALELESIHTDGSRPAIRLHPAAGFRSSPAAGVPPGIARSSAGGQKLLPMPSTLCGPGGPPPQIDPCGSTSTARTCGPCSLK